MKVLFTSHATRGHGGAEVVLRDLILSLPKNRVESQCVFSHSSGGFRDALEFAGIKTHTVPFTGWLCQRPSSVSRLLNFYLNGRRSVDILAKIIHDEKIELVVSNTTMVLDGALAAFVAGVPHVWYIHELLDEDPDLNPLLSIPLDLFYPLVCELSRDIITVSEAVRGEIEGFIDSSQHSKIKVVYNGIKVNEIRCPRRLHNNTVLSVGYHCPRKGFEYLIRAAKNVCEVIPDVRFVIAGRSHNPYSRELEKTIEDYGLRENFQLVRFTDEIDNLYANASIFVMSSLCEPFGLVILEAMRAGLPVISTMSGGPQEIITHRRNGILTSLDRLDKEILCLLKDEDFGDELGIAGFEHVKRAFTFDSFVNTFLHVIGA